MFIKISGQLYETLPSALVVTVVVSSLELIKVVNTNILIDHFGPHKVVLIKPISEKSYY